MTTHLSLLRHVSLGSAALCGGFVIRKAGVLILAGVMTRRAGGGGVAALGVYCAVLVVLEFAARLSIFGTDILLVKAVSSRNAEGRQLIGNTFAWRSLSALLIYGLLVGTTYAVDRNGPLPQIVAIMGVGMVAQVLSDTYLSIVQGLERVHLTGYVQMLCQGIGLGLALALWVGYGLVGVAIAYTVRAGLFLASGAVVCHVLDQSVAVTFSPRRIGSILKQGAPIAGGRLLTVVYLGSGVLVIERVCGATAAGLLAGPMKLFEALAALGLMTATAAFPTLSRLRGESVETLQRIVTALIRTIVWGGIPACVLLGLNAERLLVTLFGAEFTGAGSTLAILCTALPFSFLFVLAERLAYAAEDQKRVAFVRAIGTLLCMGVLLFGATRFGPHAAVAGVLSAEVLMSLLFLHKMRTYAPGVRLTRIAGPAVVACVLALLVALCVPHRAGLDSLVFAGVFAACGLFGSRVLSWFREAPGS